MKHLLTLEGLFGRPSRLVESLLEPEMVEQQPECEQLPEEEQQPKTMEDSEKHNVVITSNNSRELKKESIKQGTGDLRACGPSTFFSVDSFIKHGENFPISGLDCAAVNTVKQNEIAIDENVECTENELKNVNENVQNDLINEKVEGSTKNSVPAEIDYNLVVIVEPVDTGGTLMNIRAGHLRYK
jgi:hypothetical protein